ncbi:MAG: PFL_4669 family integrating conjugative element protein, partial [Saezia sp.]
NSFLINHFGVIAMAETETFRLNIGVLRSQMSLQIHTRQAARLWHGRRRTEEHESILGLSAFLSITNRINLGSRQDDPYSDLWMLRVEEKLDQVAAQLKTLKTEVDRFYENVPTSFTLSENLNVQPANLPIFAGSHLGYLAIFILAQYDEIVRKIMLAHHIALIDFGECDYWLGRGDYYLRSLFHWVQKYRFAGVTRKDFAEGNVAAQAAIEKYGAVPPEIMDGTRRSRFSPPLRTGTENEAASEDTDDIVEDENGALTITLPSESELEPPLSEETEAEALNE